MKQPVILSIFCDHEKVSTFYTKRFFRVINILDSGKTKELNNCDIMRWIYTIQKGDVWGDFRKYVYYGKVDYNADVI